MSAENIEKLPKWAQTKIQVLEARIASLQRTLAAMDAGETDTWIRDDLTRVGKRIYLPSGATVCFGTDRDVIQVRRRNARENDAGWLDVNGSRCLTIAPRSGNSVYIDVERYPVACALPTTREER